MAAVNRPVKELLAENEELRLRLEEAEETLRAIGSGEVDAFVVSGPAGDQVFTLKGAEQPYRVLVETMNEGTLTLGLDMTILFCNKRFCDMVKSTMTDTIGKKLTVFVAPAQQQPLWTLLEDAQAGPVQRQLTLLASDGGFVSVQLAASPLVADSHTSICLVASDLTELEEQASSIRGMREQQQALEENRAELLREVAERKKAEEAASRSEKTFAELVERAPFGIYVVDSQFRVAQMNAGSQSGAFRNVRPLIGRDFAEAMRILWPEPVAAEIIGIFRHTLDTGESYYSPRFTNPRHDIAAIESYEWELHRMTLPDGQYGVICYYFDSTRLREAEEALRQSEARFRSVVENMSEGLMLFDGQGLIYQNPSSMRIHRFKSPEEMRIEHKDLPKTWKGWDETGRPLPFEEWPVSRVLRHERFQDQVLRAVCIETGHEFYGSYNGSAILGPDGNLALGFITIRDITDRKLAEETLQEAHDELARLVGERTRELQEKEVLLKEIHHRVKNNLQVISSLVSLQAEGSEDETVRGVLKDVTNRVRSMALVHEKLYQSTDLAHIDFAEYSRSLLGYLWRAHGSAASSIRLNLALSPVGLPVDTAVPCGLILNELAGNALKHAFMDRTEGEVNVSLHYSEESRISLIVADNGVGLPEGLDWRQAKSLGLQLVQMLSSQIGASVEMSSGEGTRFEIVFCSPS